MRPNNQRYGVAGCPGSLHDPSLLLGYVVRLLVSVLLRVLTRRYLLDRGEEGGGLVSWDRESGRRLLRERGKTIRRRWKRLSEAAFRDRNGLQSGSRA